MKQHNEIKKFFIFLLLTGTLFAKGTHSEFLLSDSLFILDRTKIDIQPLTPRQLIEPVLIDTECTLDFTVII